MPVDRPAPIRPARPHRDPTRPLRRRRPRFPPRQVPDDFEVVATQAHPGRLPVDRTGRRGAAGRGLPVRRAELAEHAGHRGHGSGSYKITVQLPDVSVLPQNSPVMVDDVTVGSVSGIDAVQRSDGTFYAAVEVSSTATSRCPRTRPPRWPRRHCWAASTSSWPSPKVNPASVGCATVRRSRSTAPAAIRPPKRCCPRSASWSTRAISVRCRTSPTRPTPRSRVAAQRAGSSAAAAVLRAAGSRRPALRQDPTAATGRPGPAGAGPGARAAAAGQLAQRRTAARASAAGRGPGGQCADGDELRRPDRCVRRSRGRNWRVRPGADKLAPAENWADLMMAPRQM